MLPVNKGKISPQNAANILIQRVETSTRKIFLLQKKKEKKKKKKKKNRGTESN
jgi:hypothetical protein